MKGKRIPYLGPPRRGYSLDPAADFEPPVYPVRIAEADVDERMSRGKGKSRRSNNWGISGIGDSPAELPPEQQRTHAVERAVPERP